MNSSGAFSSKKRTSNFNNEEKAILLELVSKYKHIIESKKTDTATNAQKVAGWENLSKEFNNMSSVCYRNAHNLKTCWENIKRNSKKEVASRKKEFFKTGGGPPTAISTSNSVVESVLGPALEGLPNAYDSDALDYIESRTASQNLPGTSQWLDSSVSINNEDIVVIVTEEEKENYSDTGNCPTKPVVIEDKLNKKENLWETWTPKMLKRPLAEPLQSKDSGEEWIKRRRPRSECSADALMREKIELVKILKKNAQEESDLRIAILREQLKQEQIKTNKLLNVDEHIKTNI